ncbi:MAG: hypothetical protein LBF67_04050 [Prevotellaceae bacterium]|nr:hypothetical protein [Prevotellaceae bacterium]
MDIKGQRISAAIGNKSVSIIVEKREGRFTIRFSGSDFTINKSMMWYESELEAGSKMAIAIKDIIAESIPAMITKIELNACSQEDSKEIIKEAEKRELAELRRILAQRGVPLPQ